MNTDTRLIPLTQGKFAIVDACDYDFLMQWRWHAVEQKLKTLPPNWYARRISSGFRQKGRENIFMHNEVAGCAGLQAAPRYDHEDHDGLNNTRKNLRPSTVSENNCSRRKSSGTSSKYKGLTWVPKRKKWKVMLSVNRKAKFLGEFSDEIAAAKAYDSAARKYHGEYAVLNNPAEPTPSSACCA